MDITVVDNQELSRYEALSPDGSVVGVAEYALTAGDASHGHSGTVVTMTHVEVDPAFEGQGIASQLTSHALDDLRSRGARVIPQCPYVVTFLKRHPEYADLVVDRTA